VCCTAGAAGSPDVAAVSAQVVPEDHYPARHSDFAGGVVGFPDLVYESLPGFRPLHLDLYRPADESAKKSNVTPHPFVVYVHGGGWMNGHTRQSGAFTNWPDVLASLAARGYVVASVEYRLSAEARFPAAEQDVKAAIRWLRSQASIYHIDETRGLIWGASAGGQLAALTATSCGVTALDPVGELTYAGEPGGPPRPATTGAAAPTPESDCVQGAVTWYGIFDFGTLAAQRDPSSSAFRDNPDAADARYLGCRISKCAPGVVAAASPVTYIDRNDPPMLLIHGAADKTVPVQQSQEMYDKLHAAGVPVQLFLVPDVDHSFIGKTPADTQKASRAALTRVFDFIDTTIGARGTK
jgi:acetyl esterase/lipase